MGKQWLPKAGEFAGELFFLFDQTLNQKERPGEKLEIKEFFSQLEKLKEDAAGKLADQIVEKALMQNPDWQGTKLEVLCRWFFPLLAKQLVNKQLEKSWQEWGIRDFMAELQKQAAQPGREAMSRQELGRFISDEVILPVLLYPFKAWVISMQRMVVVLSLLALLAPAALVKVINYFGFFSKPVA